MTNKEIVINVLKEHPCLTSAQVHNYALRMFNTDITPQTASSIMRNYSLKGFLGESRHPINGKKVYWLTDSTKEALNNNEFSF